LGRPGSDIKAKLGVGGFYDLWVGGHAGLIIKPGVVFADRFETTFLIVPTGSDSERSYGEALGLETKEEADEFYEKHGQRVMMPYYGLMLTVKF